MAMLKPEKLFMGDLLGDRIPFRIPAYQRGYSWQLEEWRDFTADLKSLWHEPDATHFLGEILSVKIDAPTTKSHHVFELVDGQQRLTTFTLLLYSVLEGIRAVGDEAARGGDATTSELATRDYELRRKDYLTYEEYEPAPSTGTFSQNRLQLSRRDDEFFRKLLKGERPRLTKKAPHSHRCLLGALEHLEQGLVEPIVDADDMTPAEKLSELLELLRALTGRCEIVHIATDSPDEAYTLFSVLNDRGRSLTDGDLLRTRTLEALASDPATQLEAENYWDKVLQWGPAAQTFLRAYYASHKGERWPSKKLHGAFWDLFFVEEKKTRDPSDVVATLAAMQEEAGAFAQIVDGDWPYEEPRVSTWHRKRLERLMKILRGAASAPLLLSIFFSRDEAFFSEAVNFLERFTFRYNLVGGHASSLGDTYYAVAKRIREDSTYSIADLKTVVGHHLARYASEDLFRTQLADQLKYGQKSAKQIAHFLTTLEDYGKWVERGAHGEPEPDTTASFDLGEINIEHIYPQSPRPTERNPDLGAMVNDLGNLTFWAATDNNIANNSPFHEKQEAYRQSKVSMTRALADVESWTAGQVIARRKSLIERAVAVFRIAVDLPVADVESVDGAEGGSLGASVWFVQQNPASRYRDREGEVYDYPESIPNARQIVPGDIFICYHAQRVARGPARIFGLGRVHAIQPDGDRQLAIYDRYVPISPELTFEDLGGDPRNNRRNSINRIDGSVLDTLLSRLGLNSVESVPHVAVDLDAVVQVGVQVEGEDL